MSISYRDPTFAVIDADWAAQVGFEFTNVTPRGGVGMELADEPQELTLPLFRWLCRLI